MKTIKYGLLALLLMYLASSCTEENIAPHDEDDPIGVPPPKVPPKG